jgi:hypothetical protein
MQKEEDSCAPLLLIKFETLPLISILKRIMNHDKHSIYFVCNLETAESKEPSRGNRIL